MTAELATAGLIAGGLLIFAFASALAWTKGTWRKTSAVVFAGERERRLRWHDTRYEICEVTLSAREAAVLEPGSEVSIFYQVRAPENWSFTSPYRRTRLAAVAGAVLAAAGTAASLTDAIDLLG